jgi:hypothetical protein
MLPFGKFGIALVCGSTGFKSLETSYDFLEDAEDMAVEWLSEFLIEGDTIKKLERSIEQAFDSNIVEIFTIQHYDNTFHKMEVRLSKLK